MLIMRGHTGRSVGHAFRYISRVLGPNQRGVNAVLLMYLCAGKVTPPPPPLCFSSFCVGSYKPRQPRIHQHSALSPQIFTTSHSLSRRLLRKAVPSIGKNISAFFLTVMRVYSDSRHQAKTKQSTTSRTSEKNEGNDTQKKSCSEGPPSLPRTEKVYLFDSGRTCVSTHHSDSSLTSTETPSNLSAEQIDFKLPNTGLSWLQTGVSLRHFCFFCVRYPLPPSLSLFVFISTSPDPIFLVSLSSFPLFFSRPTVKKNQMWQFTFGSERVVLYAST